MIKLKNILSEIVVKPTDLSAKLKRALVDAMYEECIVDYDGDFDKWDAEVQIEFDNQTVSHTYYNIFQDLRKEIGDEEAEEFFMSDAPGLVEKMVEEKGLDEIVVKPTQSYKFKVGDTVGNAESTLHYPKVGKILKVASSWQAVKDSPTYSPFSFEGMLVTNDNEDKPWYEVEWRSNQYATGKTYWQPESALKPVELDEIVVKPTQSFFFRKKDRIYGKKDRSVLKVKDVFNNLQDALAKYPKQKEWADQCCRTGAFPGANESLIDEPWYAVGENSKHGNYIVNVIIVPESILKDWGGYTD